MGFKNSPNILQGVMDNVLEQKIDIICFIYGDDILIFVKNEKIHDGDCNE